MARNGRAGERARGRRVAVRPDHGVPPERLRAQPGVPVGRSRRRSVRAVLLGQPPVRARRRARAFVVSRPRRSPPGRSGCSSSRRSAAAGRGEDGRGVLHVINIRDWHVPDDNYDFERRRYGAHCEAGTWGAGYVDGLEGWLDPAGPLPVGGGALLRAGKRSHPPRSCRLDLRLPAAARAHRGGGAQVQRVRARGPARRDRAGVGGRPGAGPRAAARRSARRGRSGRWRRRSTTTNGALPRRASTSGCSASTPISR